jgi:hypothetical protein
MWKFIINEASGGSAGTNAILEACSIRIGDSCGAIVGVMDM